MIGIAEKRRFNTIAKNEYKLVCPLVEMTVSVVDSAPWFNSDIDYAKREKK